MDLNRQMKEDEQEIKDIVDTLDSAQGQGLKARCDREFQRDRLALKLARMRSVVDVSMSGHSGHERSVLECKLRLQFPFYAHLTSISSLSRNEAVACDLWESGVTTAGR